MKHVLYPLAAALLLGSAVSAHASFKSYIQAQPPKPVPSPSADSVINCVCPENNGGYLAVWDLKTSGNAVVERRDATNVLVWQQVFTPSTAGENTRVVLTGDGRVLWASAYRWFLLDQVTGTILKNGDWNYPDLDPRKLIIRNDIFYIQQGQQLTGFDKNMDCIGTFTTELDQDRWEVVEGTWLIDRSDRTNHILRFATLNDSLQAVDVHEVSLLTSREGGTVSHMPIGANANTLVVASTLEWTPRTQHFFTQVTRDGEVLWQNNLSGSEHLTGSAMLTNGWLLTGIDFNVQDDNQYLLVLDFCGWPQPRQHYYPSTKWEYVVLNTDPPRLLHTITDNNLEIYELILRRDWAPWWWDHFSYWTEYWIGPAFVPDSSLSYWRTLTTPPS